MSRACELSAQKLPPPVNKPDAFFSLSVQPDVYQGFIVFRSALRRLFARSKAAKQHPGPEIKWLRALSPLFLFFGLSNLLRGPEHRNPIIRILSAHDRQNVVTLGTLHGTNSR
jgi:hypothetical protein